jgi:hypothetical protein
MNAFVIVTPTRNTPYLSSAEAVDEVVSRRNDFPNPIQIYSTVGNHMTLSGCICLASARRPRNLWSECRHSKRSPENPFS